VFFEVAQSTSLTLLIAGLDLQLALARAALLVKRRERLAIYFERHPTYFRLESYIAVAELKICSEKLEIWHAERIIIVENVLLMSMEGCVSGSDVNWVRGYFQMEAQDREVVQDFCDQFKSR